MSWVKRRSVAACCWLAIIAAAEPACSHPDKQSHLRREYHNAAVLALDALQKASQFRDSAAGLFDPRKADVVGDDVALQILTKANDPVESRISSQIQSCDKALRAYRATFAQNDRQVTEQSGDIVDTCIANARKLFNAAQ